MAAAASEHIRKGGSPEKEFRGVGDVSPPHCETIRQCASAGPPTLPAYTRYPASFGWIVFASVRKPFRLGLGTLLLLSPI